MCQLNTGVGVGGLCSISDTVAPVMSLCRGKGKRLLSVPWILHLQGALLLFIPLMLPKRAIWSTLGKSNFVSYIILLKCYALQSFAAMGFGFRGSAFRLAGFLDCVTLKPNPHSLLGHLGWTLTPLHSQSCQKHPVNASEVDSPGKLSYVSLFLR